jgi:hypothetical protein
MLNGQAYQGSECKEYQSETVGPLAVLRRLLAVICEDGDSKWNHSVKAVSERRMLYRPSR